MSFQNPIFICIFLFCFIFDYIKQLMDHDHDDTCRFSKVVILLLCRKLLARIQTTKNWTILGKS